MVRHIPKIYIRCLLFFFFQMYSDSNKFCIKKNTIGTQFTSSNFYAVIVMWYSLLMYLDFEFYTFRSLSLMHIAFANID